jgi:biuret amidohydrolase
LGWKTERRSFYTRDVPEPPDPVLERGKVAFLVIDLQHAYLDRPDPATLSDAELARYRAWAPFHERVRDVVVPNVRRLLARFRAADLDVFYARVASRRADGRDRALIHRRPGWNDVLLADDDPAAQIVEALAPVTGEIVVTKTTDSALTGTNLRLLLANVGITHVVCAGVLTDQCVSSTVRSLVDESFEVIVLDDACAAGTDELHARELEGLNLVYGLVMTVDELMELLPS